MSAPFSFILPEELSAKEPPERRGLGRDKVRLLVIDRGSGAVQHAEFEQLAEFLRKGDLLVFNSSRTLPASLEACCSGHGPCLQVRLAQHLPDDTWLALLVCKAGDPFGCGLRAGMQLEFSQELTGEVFDRDARIPRLWKIRFSKTGTELIDLIYRIGQPVRYEYVSRRGIWIITKPFTRRNRARLRCRQPGAPSPGGRSSNCAVVESILRTSFCILVCRLIWMTNSIALISLQRRNIF